MITPEQILNFYKSRLSKYGIRFIATKTELGEDRVVIYGGNLEVDIEIRTGSKGVDYVLYMYDFRIRDTKVWYFKNDIQFLEGLNKLEGEFIESLI